MKLMEKYLSESNIKTLISLKEALQEDKVTVACMGLYNHGKSTLLNALIGDLESNTFKVADIRETSKNKKIPYNNIYYLDTPGLNANDEDDKQVMEAIKKADIVIFTHNINTGGLVEAEKIFLQKINKYWKNPKSFLDRSIFVLSRIDNINDKNDIDKTSKEIATQIKEIFNYQQHKIIPVSANDYIDGLKYNENELIIDSNIDSLIENINYLSERSKIDIFNTKNERLNKQYSELYFKLNNRIEENKNKIYELENKQKIFNKNLKIDIKKIEDTLGNMYASLK